VNGYHAGGTMKQNKEPNYWKPLALLLIFWPVLLGAAIFIMFFILFFGMSVFGWFKH
jgi:hypothetical protein